MCQRISMGLQWCRERNNNNEEVRKVCAMFVLERECSGPILIFDVVLRSGSRVFEI